MVHGRISSRHQFALQAAHEGPRRNGREQYERDPDNERDDACRHHRHAHFGWRFLAAAASGAVSALSVTLLILLTDGRLLPQRRAVNDLRKPVAPLAQLDGRTDMLGKCQVSADRFRVVAHDAVLLALQELRDEAHQHYVGRIQLGDLAFERRKLIIVVHQSRQSNDLVVGDYDDASPLIRSRLDSVASMLRSRRRACLP